MRKYTLNEITLMQYIFLIHGAQVGTGILSLPRQVAEKSGTDGWVTILVAWVINCLAGWIILLTLRKYPNFTMLDLFSYLFGKWFGKLLFLPLIAYFAFFGLDILVNSMLYIKAWFLTKTPGYLVLLLFAIPTYLVVRNGLRVQARYVELVFYMMLWIPFFLLFPLGRAEPLHLLPVLKEGWGPVLKGLPTTVFAYAGIEVLFFIHPFLQNKKYAIHGFLIANTMTMLYYMYVTIVCFVFYTPDGITTLNQPVLSLLKNIEFRFLERFDMVILAFYLFVVSKAWIIYIYCTVFSTSQIRQKHDHRLHSSIYLLLAIGVVYVVKPTWNQADEWVKLLTRAGMIVMYVLPVLLYVYVRGFELFRRGKAE
ncbi:spore gernimation protein [Brevibacillus fluminis]|uniref:Spore gernimation protein n=1 Tax=Brevibacillus fluminis TaxID=511487 RepID=A0A3M8DSP9_9BACL|nr:GerAB/ArcD/ProY family transporter [Brevibacillus fluminis]RNB90475.1 spore gernimation protein [Brevibacillus fluminis]